MVPVGLSQIIQSFSNVIAKMTNPFTPLLFANLMVDTFSVIIFFGDHKQLWVLAPALFIWAFTLIVYAVFAIKAPHMLSATTIQKLGMQLEAGIGQQGKEEIPADRYENLPDTTADYSEGNHDRNDRHLPSGRTQ